MKIALGNLNHKTVGKHSAFIPLGVAYIASYIIENLDDIEIRIYDDTEKIINDIKEWSPDVIGLSNYCWNSNLSSIIFKYAKRNNPNIVTVSGGPDFPEDIEEIEEYIRSREEIDFYIYREGEIPFLNLLKEIRKDSNLEIIKQKDIEGIVNIDPISKNVIIGKPVGRIDNLDIIPSPYLNNLLDSWMEGTHVPSIETTRGCPFLCLYCHTGNTCYNKIGKFSADRIKEELDYISNKMRNSLNVPLSICDTNFGIYKKDVEIIDHIKKIQLRNGWPVLFDVTTGKMKYKKILDMIKYLGGAMNLDCAVQSMHEPTLKIIKRDNPAVEELRQLQEEANKNNIITISEFIMPLPEETKDSFLEGIKTIMDSDIRYIFPYTTMLLKGTELSSKDSRRKYSMKSKYRLLPKMFGEYAGEKCFEIEEVCVSTNTMSYDEYVECRGFILISYLIGSDQTDVIPRINKHLGISNFDFVSNLWNLIKDGNGAISNIYREYIEETKNELWDTPEDIYQFFSKDENYGKLLDGDLGDNLIRKYRTKINIKYYKEIMDLFFCVIESMADSHMNEELKSFLDDSKNWAVSVRDISKLLCGDIDEKVKKLSLSYDIREWYSDNDIKISINSYKKIIKYNICYSDPQNIKSVLSQRNKFLGSDYFYNIGKLMNDGRVSFLWRDCELVK